MDFDISGVTEQWETAFEAGKWNSCFELEKRIGIVDWHLELECRTRREVEMAVQSARWLDRKQGLVLN